MKRIFLFFIFVSSFCFSQTLVVRTYSVTGSDMFIVPMAVTSLTIECTAGGGGGNNSILVNSGNGGGGGAYSSYIFSSIGGETLNITVGEGGSPTRDGAFSSVNYLGLDICLAEQGYSGAGSGGGGQAINGIGDIVFSGGNGSAGGVSDGGGGGGGAGNTGNGGNGSGTTGGGGAPTYGGKGGKAGDSGDSATNGDLYGGGGGGASIPNPNGASGGQGLVIITYIAPPNSNMFLTF